MWYEALGLDQTERWVYHPPVAPMCVVYEAVSRAKRQKGVMNDPPSTDPMPLRSANKAICSRASLGLV